MWRNATRWGINSYVVKSMAPDNFSQTVQSAVKYWLQLNHTILKE